MITSSPAQYPLLLLNPPGKVSASLARISHSIMGDFSYLEYSLKSDKEHIDISVADAQGFYFLYCWEGELALNCIGGPHQIGPHQSALLHDKSANGITLQIRGNGDNRFCVISFTEKRHSFYAKLKSQFYARLSQGSTVFVGPPYLKLLEKIDALSRLSKQNVSAELIMEGLVFQILGLKMEQLLENAREICGHAGSLTGREMAQIGQMAEVIGKNPAADYTVEWLCRETGLSPAKLQGGFKAAYGRTVIDYIRHVRLEKARELIQTSDLNISEVVYSIGLTSRSYFSKIFKQKFKCSPKTFQEQVREV